MGDMVTIKFRPLDVGTLMLLVAVYESEGSDPAAAFSRHISTAMLSAAILGLTPEQLSQQVDEMYAQAQKCVAERPDIFGGL